MSARAAPPRTAGLRVSDMQTFVALAAERHFGRTAERLHTSQPVISTRLARLEGQLGVRLIERGGREFSLTSAGQTVAAAFRAVLGELADLEARLDGNGDAPEELRIGAIDSVVATWLPGLVEALRARFPGLRIELTVDSTHNLVAALTGGALDIIFAVDPVLDSRFGNFIACVYEMSWVAAPALAPPGRLHSVDDLARMAIITFPRDTPPYRAIAPYFQDEKVLADKLTSCNSLFAIVSLVADGFGIGAIPTVAVKRELDAGTLVAMRVAKRFPPLPVVASHRLQAGPLMAEVIDEVHREVRAFCARLDPPTMWTE